MASDSESSSRNSDSETERYSDIVRLDGIENEVFDNDLEPLATEEEANAYAIEVAREQQEQHELSRRFNREVTMQSWYVCIKILYKIILDCLIAKIEQNICCCII